MGVSSDSNFRVMTRSIKRLRGNGGEKCMHQPWRSESVFSELHKYLVRMVQV